MLKRFLAILLALGVPAGAIAAIALVGAPGSTAIFTPDQITAAMNFIINAINTQSITCTTTGCAAGVTAPPVITGTCATAGGGAGFVVQAGSNAFAGRFTCATTPNTTTVITWATARSQPAACNVTAETVAITLPLTSVTAAAISFAYASTANPIFDYVCQGQ